MCAHRLTTADVDAGANISQPLHGLQPVDVMVAHSVLRSLAPAWILDEHHDADTGALMLMLTAPGPEDTTPTFVLSHAPHGIQVAVALGDSCDTLHTASNIRRAIRMALSLGSHSMELLCYGRL